MHWSGTRLVVLASTLLLTGSVLAQQTATTPVTVSIPNLIRYGGSLHDASGASLSSRTVGITFAIYPQQDGGAPIWMETQNVTIDAAGNYNVLLGSTTSTGLPGDLFSQQEQRWLGVQVQGEPEEQRVLLVSVPYAFKAHEAETLGGKSVSDFVLANGAGTSAPAGNSTQGASSSNGGIVNGTGAITPSTQGPTNFSGSTTDQIVGVTQTGTGAAVNASAVAVGVIGRASQASGTTYGVEGFSTGIGGIGVLGNETSTTGVTEGVKGSAISTSGIGVRATETAATGSTSGVSAMVTSASGTAGVFNNAGGGKIISGQNNGAEKFSVDGVGNVTSSGKFTGDGSSLTGIQFSQLVGQLGSTQLSGSYSNAVSLSNSGNSFSGSGAGLTGIPFANLSGTLASAQLSGTYSHAVTLSSTSNSFTGNGAGLTGVIPAGGSTNYIQNQNTSPQHSANFDISGNGTLGSYLTAYGGVSGIISSATGNAVFGSATTTTGTTNGVYGLSVSPGGTGVSGANTATSGTAYGVAGSTASTTGNAVYGNATTTTGTANGVYGQTASNGGAGVYGRAASATGITFGVFGQAASPSGAGVYGANTATSGNAYGVAGYTASTATNASGVFGQASSTTGNTYGVTGKNASSTGVGVYGWASSTTGNDSGMVGQTDSTTDFASGVFGVATAAGGGQTYGVVGSTNSTTQNASGVYGNTGNSTEGSTNGVFGTSASKDGTGVYGTATSTDTSGYAYGVYGTSANGTGVFGSALSSSVCAAGVSAHSASTCADAVYAVDTATSGNANGIYAQTDSPQGVAGYFNNGGGGYILVGTVNGNGTHLFHVDGAGDGYFAGDLSVGGTLSKGGGSFKIDDPLDPENKTLSHSFVESPDMMNIYNGNVSTDKHGFATIVLPEYFEALNRDFRYQLTVVGQFAQAIVSREIEGNSFTIRTNKPAVKVSWQVTGIRQDVWANAHRIPVEQEKTSDKRGKYLYPELYGASGGKNTDAMLHH